MQRRHAFLPCAAAYVDHYPTWRNRYYLATDDIFLGARRCSWHWGIACDCPELASIDNHRGAHLNCIFHLRQRGSRLGHDASRYQQEAGCNRKSRATATRGALSAGALVAELELLVFEFIAGKKTHTWNHTQSVIEPSQQSAAFGHLNERLANSIPHENARQLPKRSAALSVGAAAPERSVRRSCRVGGRVLDLVCPNRNPVEVFLHRARGRVDLPAYSRCLASLDFGVLSPPIPALVSVLAIRACKGCDNLINLT